MALDPTPPGMGGGAPDLVFPGRSWKWFALRGVLTFLLGILAILFPLTALFAFTLVFAAFALVDGIFSLAAGFGGRGAERWWAQILRGLLGILVGAIFVLMPLIAVIGYALATLAIIAAWAILAGIFDIAAAVQLRMAIRGEWLLGLAGAISILFGLAIPFVLWIFPAATILSVAWIIGIYALASGIVLAAQGLRLRRAAERA